MPRKSPAASEFLNSKSMVTPAAAGATTMILTGSLVSAFNLPGAWVALLVSAVFAALVAMADKSVPAAQRAIFYVVNSLTIFSVAYGLNTVGFESQATSTQTRGVDEQVVEEGFFRPWPIGK